MSFAVNKEFNSFEEILQEKSAFERQNNVILVCRDSRLLKGEGEAIKRLIYSRVTLSCKAGKERPTESKGMRKSATFKKNCPMKINIVFKKDKLKVSSVNLIHENHQCNEMTYHHYPEQLRLSDEEKVKAGIMLAADGKKFKIKAKLMATRKEQGNKAPVSLKSIHNLQTATRTKKEKLIPGENELEKLLASMLEVPGAKVRVLRDENDELCCIFFQDPRMTELFDKYPEIVLFDATYKMNDRDMPLFIQSVVDGNGITEIVTLAICKSESRVVIEFVLDCFKELNPNWNKIKCVIGDKDFADRVVYKEKLVGIVMQICLFHVLRTFNREISAKRGITKDQREKALGILQQLCYANSMERYDELYVNLCQLNIESVTDYYNTNWHNIREEWTLYGRNSYSNYLNSTNNRSETMNQKVKMIGTRNSNLLTFFENVSTSLSVLASEKDIKAVRLDMRTERVRFDNVSLLNYHQFLTPFIFSKINIEFKNMDLVTFASCDMNVGTTNSGRTVTSSKCSCEFHLSMLLPCRHILQFRKRNEIDMFAPELCASRWTLQYYNKSHPALQMNDHNPVTTPIFIQKVRVPEEKDKYKAAASITREITSLVSTMTTGEYTFYLDKLKNIKHQIIAPATVVESEGVVNSVTGANSDNNNTQLEESNISVALDLSIPKAGAGLSDRVGNGFDEIPSHFEVNGNNSTQVTVNDLSPIPVNGSSQLPVNSSSPLPVNGSSQLSLDPYDSRLIIVAPTTKDIQQIKLPYKHVSIGRPKGSINTVIGTKRKPKRSTIKTNTKKAKIIPAVLPSDQMNQHQRCEILRIRKKDGIYGIIR